MASGMIVDFTIDPDLVGIAIGKKGARIKQVPSLSIFHFVFMVYIAVV
jgi:hypothetical protein